MGSNGKKVGILNFHYSEHNYGAVLQAAALADVVTKLGYVVEHIDFIPSKIPQKKTIRQLLVGILLALGIKTTIKRLLGRQILIKPPVQGSEVFEDFRSDWIPRSVTTYRSAEQLTLIGEAYAAVIVGSDQVWRPSMYVNMFQDVSVYFLSFLPASVNRISYAASFGVDHWEEKGDVELTQDVGRYLAQFNAISVRECSGVSICRDVFAVNAEHVLDPTLLNGVDFFERIICKANVTQQKRNIVYYKLDVDDAFLDSMKTIGQLLNTPCEDIYYQKDNKGYHYIPVAEWLAKIRDSEFVVTDSFHCVCLAILFNKDFVCFANKGRGLARLQSLLDSVDIEGRLCSEQESLYDFIKMLNPIDYDSVNVRLKQLREQSNLFIREALSNV